MSATAAASESSFPLERPDGFREPEIAGTEGLELPMPTRSTMTLVSLLVLIELGWLGVIAYGFITLVH